MSKKDSTWREYNIHGSAEDENQPVDIFAMSASGDNAYETFQYDIDDTIQINIRAEAEYDKSTGMSVWKGSEVMCTYLRQHPEIVHNKKVLELGAGCGLCGLVCRIALDPKSVLISDGDHKVLDNLRFNVKRNGLQLADDASPSVSVDDDESIIAVPQLIWGKNHAINFTKQYGKQNVIIATDCVYMTQSVIPLFETINEVLDNTSESVFLFVNTCASACPIETVYKIANDAGFISSEEEHWYYEDDREQRKHPVHVFRRRK